MTSWILIVVGVILTQALVLNLKFQRRAKGYLLRATSWIWQTLALIVVIETVIAGTFVELGSRIIPLNLPPLPFLVGVLAVLLPRGFEELVLYRNFSEKKIKSSLARMLRKLNLAATHEFGGAIRTRIEQDVFDWQTQSSKYFGLSPAEFRRRIRQVYYCHVEEVASLRHDPGLLFRDVGFSPYGHLYILAEHLGRKRLISELKTVNLEWSGHETRKVRGTIADRAEPDSVGRFYDNEDLIKRIRKGESSKGKKTTGEKRQLASFQDQPSNKTRKS
jgi:hypothetical protein